LQRWNIIIVGGNIYQLPRYHICWQAWEVHAWLKN
jgi:hypothetical protein